MTTYAEHMRAQARAYWLALMAETQFNVSRAARIAGMSRPSVHDHLRRHGIQRHPQRTEWEGGGLA